MNANLEWSADEALQWADAWAACDGPPNGDAIALEALAKEVRRLRDIVGKDGMRRVERLESALKVIHTWSSFDGELRADHVQNLARRALDGVQ